MKRILFLAPHCLPINSPEAICNAKLLRELSKAGYIIDVISKKSLSTYVPDSIDKSFSENLNSLEIICVSNKINMRTIWEHLCVFLKTGYVYKGAHWAYRAIQYAEKNLMKYHYDWIMSRSSPSELAALYLSQKYHIKWIANWNDPYPMKRFPAPYGGGIYAKLSYMRQTLLDSITRTANIHTFPCIRLRNYMLRYMEGISLDRTSIIPHICLDDLLIIPNRFSMNELLLVHSGNVSYPRNPEPFLKGVRLFLDKEENAMLKIFFIGQQDIDFQENVKKMHLDGIIETVEPMAYMENLKFVSQCDVALLIEANCDEGIFLPTKVGDYMQCKKDIFAISPSVGTLSDLYKNGAIKYFANCNEETSICSELQRIYANRERYRLRQYEGEIYAEYDAVSIIENYRKILG